MIEATTMSSKGQLTVPLSFHKKLGLTEGTKVAFVEGEDDNVHVLNVSSLSQKKCPGLLFWRRERNGFAK